MDVIEKQNTTNNFLNFTKREVLGIVVALIIGCSSFVAWQFFAVVMAPSKALGLGWLAGCFFLVAIFFLFGAVVWTHFSLQIIGAALLFLPGLFFIQAREYIVVGCLAAVCLYLSSRLIAREESERTRFHFYKNVRAGSFLFTLGFSLLLSSAYYVSLQASTWEDLVPRFRIGEGVTKVVFNIAGTVNPSFREVAQGDVSVDEFLLSLGKNQEGTAPVLLGDGNDSAGLMNQVPTQMAQDIYLTGGRKQIASLVGRPVSGNEKISDVLSVALQNKLIALLSGEKKAESVPSQAIPFFLALLLFLTLLSLSSVVIPLCIWGAQMLFHIARAAKWLKLEKFMVEQETLVP